MKKVLSVLLAALMVFSFSVTAFAATGNNTTQKGTITVQQVEEGKTYSAYKVFDLVSYNTETKAYVYTVAAGWEDFIAASDAVSVVDDVVVWADGASAADFAQAALAYAKENNIPAVQTKTAGAEDSLTFAELDLGYYLIDSSLGSLCILTTTNPTATVYEKNGEPTLDKEVKEDSTGEWGDSNTVDVGQTIEFQATIIVKLNTENYVMHDTMANGLEYTGVTGITAGGNALQQGVNRDYVIVTNPDDGCTFHVEFTNSCIEKLEPGTAIVVSYTGVLTADAITANPYTNEAYLDYDKDGRTESTEKSTTTTYTYEFDIVKTDSDNKLINGAVFELYRTEDDSLVTLVDLGNGKYRIATADDETTTTSILVNGKVTIAGLDAGQYYLKETQAPDGYNKLKAPKDFEIQDANLTAQFVEEVYTPNTGVQVINKSGIELPSTGGIGTTVFYIAGGAIVLAVGVLLVVKTRMRKVND